VLKRGWPDFIAFNETSVRFIEVKKHKGDQLRPHQKRVASILKKFFGIEVEVIYPKVEDAHQTVFGE